MFDETSPSGPRTDADFGVDTVVLTVELFAIGSGNLAWWPAQ